MASSATVTPHRVAAGPASLLRRLLPSAASILRRVAVPSLLVVFSSQLPAHGTHSELMAQVDAELEIQPDNGELWYRRALIEFEHEDWSGTASDLEKAERFAPGMFPVLWWKGQLLDKQERPEEAKAALDTFLAATPDHWGALASRARVEAKLGLDEQSLTDFRVSLASNPAAEPDLVQEVARALADHRLTDEAVQVLEAGLTRLGSPPSLQLEIVGIEVDAGRYDSALARVDTLQRTAPRPEPWMVKRAGILAEAGRLSQSRAAWQSLIAHLNALPPAERDSHAMMLLSEKAHQALAAMASSPALSWNSLTLITEKP